MNKKRTIERIATIALTTFLVGMFCYQVVYGTNESSYKYGYKQGKDEFVNYQDFDADCTSAPDDCLGPVLWYTKNATTGYYSVEHRSYDIMTNKTACMDGYSQGWEHSCKNNGVSSCLKTMASFQMQVLYARHGTRYRCDVARMNNGQPCFNTDTGNGWHYDARGGWFGWQ